MNSVDRGLNFKWSWERGEGGGGEEKKKQNTPDRKAFSAKWCHMETWPPSNSTFGLLYNRENNELCPVLSVIHVLEWILRKLWFLLPTVGNLRKSRRLLGLFWDISSPHCDYIGAGLMKYSSQTLSHSWRHGEMRPWRCGKWEIIYPPSL